MWPWWGPRVADVGISWWWKTTRGRRPAVASKTQGLGKTPWSRRKGQRVKLLRRMATVLISGPDLHCFPREVATEALRYSARTIIKLKMKKATLLRIQWGRWMDRLRQQRKKKSRKSPARRRSYLSILESIRMGFSFYIEASWSQFVH